MRSFLLNLLCAIDNRLISLEDRFVHVAMHGRLTPTMRQALNKLGDHRTLVCGLIQRARHINDTRFIVRFLGYPTLALFTVYIALFLDAAIHMSLMDHIPAWYGWTIIGIGSLICTNMGLLALIGSRAVTRWSNQIVDYPKLTYPKVMDQYPTYSDQPDLTAI